MGKALVAIRISDSKIINAYLSGEDEVLIFNPQDDSMRRVKEIDFKRDYIFVENGHFSLNRASENGG